MKKTPLLAKLRLILIFCCVVVLAVLIYSDYKLEQVLSFAELQFDHCLIEYHKLDDQARPDADGVIRATIHRQTSLQPDEANDFADQLESGIRKYAKKILPGDFFNFGPTHEMVFKSNDSIWQFQFGYKHTIPGSACIDYRTKPPTVEGTIFLKKGAGPQLQALIERFAAEEPNTQSSAGNMDSTILDIRKDPNAYYDGCVSCTLAIEKRGFLFKRIFVKATFKNETDYPIPVEKRHLEPGGFGVYRDGEVVPYMGPRGSREPSRFPWEYYILPPHATYVRSTNLSKRHHLSKKGRYKVQYLAFNSLTDVLKQPYLLRIESEPVEFEK